MTMRKVGTPFTLTETEEKVLALKRSGLSHREIAVAMGWNSSDGRAIGIMTSKAVEKDRQRRIIDKGHGEGSSLSKARGNVRMEGTK